MDIVVIKRNLRLSQGTSEFQAYECMRVVMEDLEKKIKEKEAELRELKERYAKSRTEGNVQQPNPKNEPPPLVPDPITGQVPSGPWGPAKKY